MVIADPSSELLALIRAHGDPAPTEATPSEQRDAHLLRRRFGLALPPPFAGLPSSEEPVRPAVATDGAAIAAVKWRTFGTSYRGGILPDAFLDGRQVVPPPSFWTGRAMVAPSRRHRLLVWGRPGTVFGYADCGPAVPGDPNQPGDPVDSGGSAHGEGGPAGEIYELYVDPSVQRGGGGSRLLAAAVDALADAGFDHLELSTITTNRGAQRFYERAGWAATGAVDHVDLASVAFDEARYARRVGPDRS